jgi:hypothetical protein
VLSRKLDPLAWLRFAWALLLCLTFWSAALLVQGVYYRLLRRRTR